MCRNSKYYMKVICINEFATTFVNPQFLKNSLTIRTVAITTGVCMEIQVIAFLTQADVETKSPRLTIHNAVSCF